MNIVKDNPSGKVPCLLLDDDQPIFDSRVICQFVDDMAGSDGSLYGSGAARFRILTLEALGDSILDACLLCRYEEVLRPKELRWDDWYDGQMAKVDSGLDDLESRWAGELAGPFHAGAIAVAAALGYLDFRFPARNWRAARAELAKWFDTTSARESMIKTKPTG